jgi:hypothetical protein
VCAVVKVWRETVEGWNGDIELGIEPGIRDIQRLWELTLLESSESVKSSCGRVDLRRVEDKGCEQALAHANE